MRFWKILLSFGPCFAGLTAFAQLPVTRDVALITAVSPGTFIDGEEAELAVTVAYDLVSAEEGSIHLGANDRQANGINFFANAPVKKGTGTVTIRGKIVPRYWSANAPAMIGAMLFAGSQPLMGSPPLGVDEKRLSLARRPQPPETDPKNPNPATIYEDGLTIKSISPETLVEGAETEVTVTVAYELLSREEGVIDLGYNEGRGMGFRIVGSTRVKIGPGTTTVSARIKPVPTGSLPFAKFSVGLIEYPYRPRGTALAIETATVEVRPAGEKP